MAQNQYFQIYEEQQKAFENLKKMNEEMLTDGQQAERESPPSIPLLLEQGERDTRYEQPNQVTILKIIIKQCVERLIEQQSYVVKNEKRIRIKLQQLDSKVSQTESLVTQVACELDARPSTDMAMELKIAQLQEKIEELELQKSENTTSSRFSPHQQGLLRNNDSQSSRINQQMKQQLQDFSQIIEEKNQLITQLQIENNNFNVGVSSSQEKEKLLFSLQKEKLQNQIKTLNEKLFEINQENDQLKRQLADSKRLNMKINNGKDIQEQMQSQINELQSKINALLEQSDQKSEQIQQLKQQCDLQNESMRQVDQLTKQLFNKNQEVLQLRSQLQNASSQILDQNYQAESKFQNVSNSAFIKQDQMIKELQRQIETLQNQLQLNYGDFEKQQLKDQGYNVITQRANQELVKAATEIMQQKQNNQLLSDKITQLETDKINLTHEVKLLTDRLQVKSDLMSGLNQRTDMEKSFMEEFQKLLEQQKSQQEMILEFKNEQQQNLQKLLSTTKENASLKIQLEDQKRQLLTQQTKDQKMNDSECYLEQRLRVQNLQQVVNNQIREITELEDKNKVTQKANAALINKSKKLQEDNQLIQTKLDEMERSAQFCQTQNINQYISSQLNVTKKHHDLDNLQDKDNLCTQKLLQQQSLEQQHALISQLQIDNSQLKCTILQLRDQLNQSSESTKHLDLEIIQKQKVLQLSHLEQQADIRGRLTKNQSQITFVLKNLLQIKLQVSQVNQSVNQLQVVKKQLLDIGQIFESSFGLIKQLRWENNTLLTTNNSLKCFLQDSSEMQSVTSQQVNLQDRDAQFSETLAKCERYKNQYLCVKADYDSLLKQVRTKEAAGVSIFSDKEGETLRLLNRISYLEQQLKMMAPQIAFQQGGSKILRNDV